MTSCPAKKTRCVAFTLGCALWFFQGAASAEPLPFDAYVARLQQVLNSAQSGQGAIEPEEVTRQKYFFPAELEVKTREGAAVMLNRVDLIRWIDEGGRSPEGRALLVRHLEALLSQLDRLRTAVPAVDKHWERSRATLEEIYGRHEFRGLKDKQSPPWMAGLFHLLQKVREWLSGALKSMGGRIPGSWIGYAFYGLLLSAAGFLLFWVVRNFGPTGWRWRSAPVARSAPEPQKRDWRSWRQKAVERASAGAFREAVRFFFISVLLEGHEQGWWAYNPEATNREHLSRVDGPSRRKDALNQLIALYENVWYGEGDAGRPSFHRCSELLKQMEAGA